MDTSQKRLKTERDERAAASAPVAAPEAPTEIAQVSDAPMCYATGSGEWVDADPSCCDRDEDLDGLFEDSQAPVARAPEAPEASSPDGEVGEKSAPNDFWREEQQALFAELRDLQFSAVRARKAVDAECEDVEEAVEWLEKHQNDEDIDVSPEALRAREEEEVALAVLRLLTVPALPVRSCLQAVHRILYNILADPESSRVRQIRLQNPRFKERVGRFPQALALLRKLGFQQGDFWTSAYVREPCLEWRLPVGSENPMSRRMERAFSLLDEVLRSPDSWIPAMSAMPEVKSELQEAIETKEFTSTARELLAEVHARRAQNPRAFQEAMRAAGRAPNPSVYRLQQTTDTTWRPLAERYPGKREFNLQDLEQMRIEEAIGKMPLYAKEYEASFGQASSYGQLVSRSYDPNYVARRALDETNIFRGSENMPPLKWCQGIADIAAEHARQMATGAMPFSHDGFHDRVRRYPIPHLSAAEWSCGMTLHSEVALRAHSLFQSEVENISAILNQYPHALIAGAPFPDYLYSCGSDHGAGEDAHWHTFHSKAAAYIREKYPNWRSGDEHGAKLVAFMMGAVSHYAADMNWHGQRLKQDNKTRGFGLGFLQFLGEIDYGCQGQLCDRAHSEGDTGGEFVIHHQLATTFNIAPLQWFIPVEDLVEIFHREPQSHPNVTSRWIIECGLEFRAAVEAVAVGGEVLFPKYARPGPFLQEQLLDFWIGGFDDMVHFSLVAWQKFASWLVQGPPDPAPPRGARSATRRALKELMALGKAVPRGPWARTQAEPRGAVSIGPPSPPAPVLGPPPEGLYGYEGSAVTFCDVDGDGELEEVRGAPGWSVGGRPLQGQVLLRKPSSQVETKLRLGTVGGRFGQALACGDFDGDGISDLAVSSPTVGVIDDTFERQAYSGEVHIFFGSKTGLGAPGWRAVASGYADVFGHTLLALGSRLVVGSPYFGRDDSEKMRPGRVHVFQPRRGAVTTPEEAEVSYEGWQDGEKFGSALCTLGDTLLIGAPGFYPQNASSGAGALYAARGGRLVSRVTASEPHGRFGHSCAAVAGKLAVGMPGKSSKALLGSVNFTGAVVLLDPSRFEGNSSLQDEEALQHPSSSWGRFGWSMASNGQKLAVSAPFMDSERGGVFVYEELKGGSGPIASFKGSSRRDRMGWDLAMSPSALLVGSPKAGASMMGASQTFNMNLAWNSGVADAARAAVEGWIKSPGHRKNLLGAFDLCGLGVAQASTGEFFFTQLFARSAGGALC
ncbi:unnamed protein product [Effrenium voratum]|nr:unnamed protein product [Effrenium voratum]